MRFTNDELWEKGEQVPSERDKILRFLHQEHPTFFNSSGIAEQALGEESSSALDLSQFSESEAQMIMSFSIAGTKKTEAIIDTLVAEGLVNKREVPVTDMIDEVDRVTNFKDDLPEDVREAGEDSDFAGKRTPLYRISEEGINHIENS